MCPATNCAAVNWPVSARRGRLHVTQRLTDRAADVVVLIDTYRTAPRPGDRRHRANRARRRSSGANRAATAVIAPGSSHSEDTAPDGWVPTSDGGSSIGCSTPCSAPATGFETTTGTLAPRAAIPPGAIVVAFSTLLDTEFALALIDLRKRGHVVVAVDVLEGSPFQDEQDPLMARMWQLQRSVMYRDMAHNRCRRGVLAR